MFNCTRNCEWTLWIEIACAIIAMDLFVTPSISLYDLCHSTIQYVSFLYACTVTTLQYVVIYIILHQCIQCTHTEIDC